MYKKSINIGIDADNDRDNVIQGAVAFLKTSPPCNICLIGNEAGIAPRLKGYEHLPLQVIPATETISMHDKPTDSRTKINSSIAIGARMLKERTLDVFCSTGNTGAVMVAGSAVVGKVKGIQRAAIYSLMPQGNDKFICLMDVGANLHLNPDDFVQLAVEGTVFMQSMYGIRNPRVALLNVGEEPGKGGEILKKAHELLTDLHTAGALSFAGNCEGRDILNSQKRIDVILCNGFVGNVVLKTLEGVHARILEQGINDGYFSSFNYENYGGAVYLGLDGVLVTGHDGSTSTAIQNMLYTGVRAFEGDINNKISLKAQSLIQ